MNQLETLQAVGAASTASKVSKKRLIVVTNPNCGICADLMSKGICQEYSKDFVLLPLGPNDKYLFDTIWKTEDWHKSLKEMILGIPLSQTQNHLDTSERKLLNDKNLRYLEGVIERDFPGRKLTGTPTFFIHDENGTKVIDIKSPELSKIISDSIKENFYKD